MPPTIPTSMRERSDPIVAVVLSPHVGRNLFCTPALALVRRRWPLARVRALVGSARGAAALERNPHVDEIRVCRGDRALLREARSADLVIGLARTAAADALGRGERPCIWVPPLGNSEHRADQLLGFVRDTLLVPSTDADRHYVLDPGPEHHARARALMLARDGQRWIGLHLGSGRTQAHGWKLWWDGRDADARLWGVERYIELARQVRADEPGTRFLLTGSRTERFLAKRFVAEIPETLDLVGRTSLLEMAAVMTRLDAFVTQDTGPLHVAAAMNTPLVALFGPTDPIATGPYPSGAHQRVLRAEHTCEIAPGDVALAIRSVRTDPPARAA